MQRSRPYNSARYPIKVILSCTREQVDESDVEILDIAEDALGQDVLSFRCPVCAEIHQSLRRG